VTSTPQDFRRFRARALRSTALWGATVGALLFAAAGPQAAFGLWFGALISALVLQLHGTDVEAQAKLMPAPAARRVLLGSLGRTALRAAALAAAYLRPELSFPWAVAGLLTGHAVLITTRVAQQAPVR
jgi:hypothetical protein